MSKTNSFSAGNLSQYMLTSIIYTTLNLDEDPVYWNDATAVKEAVERLEDVNMDYFRPLDEIKEQLNINPGRHMEFVEFGGADVLCDLLKNGNSVMQRKCMRAFEVLLKNEAPRKKLREMGIGDTFLKIIRASVKRPQSFRRAKAGEVLKLLVGSSNAEVLFQSPQRHESKKNKPSTRFSQKRKLALDSGRIYGLAVPRERPIPFWYFTTNPILPWDTETVSSLVDLVLSDGVEERHQDCAYRIIRKILYIGQFTHHIVIDPDDISDLISIITSMHSASIHVVKAVTCASIMHSANGVAFVQNGGLEALASSLKSDNMGNICGEISAWATAHFCKTMEDAVGRFLEAGGAEALVELSHSTDQCSRDAAVHGLATLLTMCDKERRALVKRLGEADLIPSLMQMLEEQANQHPRNQAMLHDSLGILLRMAKPAAFRAEICDLNGVALLERCLQGAARQTIELGRRVQRLLSTRSQRMSLVWKSSNKKGKSFRSRIVHKLKKVFKHETPGNEPHQGGSSSSTDPGLSSQSESFHVACRREMRTCSMSSLSSSVHSDYREGFLATAPVRHTGMTLNDYLDNNSPKFRTSYSMQPFSDERGYDKDFDPFIFGGRALSLNKVEENDHVWTLGSSDYVRDTSSGEDPELIATHDFL